MLTALTLLVVAQTSAPARPPAPKAPPTRVTVAVLVRDRAKWDKKPVIVEGRVSGVQEKVSRRKNPYTEFTLSDGGAKVNVYVRTHLKPKPKDGERVRVTGLFEKERKVGPRTILNQVSAMRDEGTTRGVVVLPASRS